MKKGFIIMALLVGSILSVGAQEERNNTLIKSEKQGWVYEVKAGINIGGTAPLPLPREIRSIDSYNPTLAASLEGKVTQWFRQGPWGLSVGLRFENKNMTTEAGVKSYSMEIINGGERMKGYWTGNVRTKVSNSYVSIPVLANYRIDNRWSVNAGPYVSYLLNGEFSGHVSDGYLRQNDPTGQKVEFTNGKIATYDFSDNLRNFQWGLQAGASWKAFKHLTVHADLTWGMNDIFKSDFKTITFAMYPIYLNLGFGYRF